MPPKSDFETTFETLRRILEQHGKSLLVQTDKPGDYILCSKTKKDRIGQPLFVAGVQIKKNYVSYHLMPIYMSPELQKTIPPALKKRMQGKACFNFTTIDRDQVKELAALTKRGIAAFKNVKLPWAPTA